MRQTLNLSQLINGIFQSIPLEITDEDEVQDPITGEVGTPSVITKGQADIVVTYLNSGNKRYGKADALQALAKVTVPSVVLSS